MGSDIDNHDNYENHDNFPFRLLLEAFGEQWNAKYKEIKPSWEADWDDLITLHQSLNHFFASFFLTSLSTVPRAVQYREK
jgi:transposase-like protein